MQDKYCSKCGADLQGSTDTCPRCETSVEKGKPDFFKVVVNWTINFMGFIVLILLIAALLPNALGFRATAQGQFNQCQSNTKNIGTALEMYSTDHKGHYPAKIPMLSPDYLKSIPTCASAAKDTYSESYSVYIAQKEGEPDAYTFYCSGCNHSTMGVSENYPQYNSKDGLIPR
jgi:type II secretory pathway pseudopilin PulG